jgi:fibronectin type 3 domain-containing protein
MSRTRSLIRRASRPVLGIGLAVVAGSGVGCANFGSLFTRESDEPPKLHASPPADLPSPEGLRASSGELRSVPLKWDPLLSGAVAGYAVERALDRQGPFSRVAIVPGRLNTVVVDRSPLETPTEPNSKTDPHTDADSDGDAGTEKPAVLDDGITVFYRVRAYAPTGQLAKNSSETVVATTAPLPAAPEDLRAYSHQPRQVPLSWRAAEDSNVTGYVVDRSPTYRGPFVELTRIDGRYETIYVDRSLGDLRVFYYRVAAFNSAGAIGTASEPVRAVTKPVPLPPIGLRVVEKRLGANHLEWDPNIESDLTEYRLQRSREGSDAPERVHHVPAAVLSVTDSEVDSDERVSYALVAVDGDGLESAQSEPIEVESEGYALSATVRPDGIHLDWRMRSEEGFVSARVVRRGILRDVELGSTEEGRFVDSEVSPDGTYRYFVVLERDDGTEAAPSSPVEIHVPDS